MNIDLRTAHINDINNLTKLVEMINEVYWASEHNIWKEGHDRISRPELLSIIDKGELLVALSETESIGCIHLEKISDELYKFKMLAVSPSFKQKGIGNKLVAFAERTAKAKGAKIMQLELIVTTDFIHPDKVVLHNWYSKIGYHKKETVSVNCCHQGLENLLITPCKAVIYQKEL